MYGLWLDYAKPKYREQQNYNKFMEIALQSTQKQKTFAQIL